MLTQIQNRVRQGGKVLITIDGPCASGKTTIAEKLAEETGAYLIHTDDFVVPHARKTQERLSIPGGNCDSERLAEEVLIPFKAGGKPVIRRYSCREDRILAAETTDSDVIILEGSYCNLPEIRALADVRLFVVTDESVRMKRLEKRESPASLSRFIDRWIPLENAYFKAYNLPDSGCILIDGNK